MHTPFEQAELRETFVSDCVVSCAVGSLIALACERSHPKQIETGGAGDIGCGDDDASCSVSQRSTGVKRVRRSELLVPGNNVVAVVGIPRGSETWDPSVWGFSAMNPHTAALRDHAGLPDLAQRIFAVADFLIHVLQVEAAIAAPLRTRSDAVLRIALNHAVRNPQRVAGLPVDSVTSALQRDVQVFQPPYAGKSAKRSRCIDHWIAYRRIAAHSVVARSAAHARVQSIQQKRLIVVYLHKTAECSPARIDSCRHIKQPGLLRVDFDKRFLAVHDRGTPARIDQRDVQIGVGILGIADKDAGIVHPAFENRSGEIHGEVGGANRNPRECF